MNHYSLSKKLKEKHTMKVMKILILFMKKSGFRTIRRIKILQICPILSILTTLKTKIVTKIVELLPAAEIPKDHK